MSKIYEALQNAQQEVKDVEKPKMDLTQTTAASPVPSVVEMDLENEMVTLFQNVESRLPDAEKKVIQFIGAREGEGTTTIVREFARVAAKKLGKSVFLLDAGQHGTGRQIFLHITPESGWEAITAKGEAAGKSDYRGGTDLEVCTAASHLSVPVNFYSPAIKDVWISLKKEYDLILIDSPPVSVSPDGLEICRRVDGVVLVMEAEKTRWQLAENLKEKILNNGGNILGLVFNKRRYYIPESIYRRL